MDNAMTRALILGATALTLSAGVASAQAVSPPDVTPPLYDYAPVPTTKSAPQAPSPTTKSVTAPQATGPTEKWVTAPEPGAVEQQQRE